MANIQSAKKRIRQIACRTKRNVARRSRIKTFLRITEIMINNKNYTGAINSLRKTEKEIMIGVSKKIFKKKTVSRKISRLNKRIKNISSQ